MTLKLPADIAQFIENRMRSGKYASPQEVVRAGLQLLENRDEPNATDEFVPGEWDRLLAEAEDGNDMSLDEAIVRRQAERGASEAGR
jgi:putative addiction module CopG family antidote